MSYLKDSAFTAVKTDAKFEIRYVKGLSSLLSHVSGASSCQDVPPISLSIHFSFTFRFSFRAVTFHLPRGGKLSSGTLLSSAWLPNDNKMEGNFVLQVPKH